VSTPPPLIPFTGDWETYEEKVYQAFLESFVKRRVLFRGVPVKAQFRPPFKGKGFSFWHVISEAPDPRKRREEDRIPDLRRCERIRWNFMGNRMRIIWTARLQLVGESPEGRDTGGDLGRRTRLRGSACEA